MTEMKVPPIKVVFDEQMRKNILASVDSILASGMVAQGAKTKEFEAFWAGYCGTKHAVTCSNGGSALEAIFHFLNVKGKEVLVPTNTFIASVNSIIMAGGKPVFLDADQKTLCVSLDEIKKRKTKDTAGVCVVHIGGIITPEIEKIADYCKSEGLFLVEDAAHAHGSEFNGKRAGKFGIAAAYSFFATKVMTSTEGGMVATDSDEMAAFTSAYRDYGKKSAWESVHSYVSMNCRMSEVSSVIGLEQAKKLDEFITHREKIAKLYTSLLNGKLELIQPQGRNSWYKYTCLLPKGTDRDALKAKLKERGVSLQGGVYDLPVHLQPVFAGLGLKGKYPAAEDVCARHICLPIFYGMTEEQAKYVAEVLLNTLEGK